jgi:hypothetical protein
LFNSPVASGQPGHPPRGRHPPAYPRRRAHQLQRSPDPRGGVIATHNGASYNADHLFRGLRLRRFAEVDSETLFRPADRTFRPAFLEVVPAAGWCLASLERRLPETA